MVDDQLQPAFDNAFSRDWQCVLVVTATLFVSDMFLAAMEILHRQTMVKVVYVLFAIMVLLMGVLVAILVSQRIDPRTEPILGLICLLSWIVVFLIAWIPLASWLACRTTVRHTPMLQGLQTFEICDK